MTLARKALLGFLGFLLFVALSGFGMAVTAKQTLLNPDFLVSRLDTLEVAPLAEDFLKDQIPDEVTAIVPQQIIDETLEDVVADLEPWLRVQAGDAIYTGYDYLWGRRANLSFEVDMGPVKAGVKEAMRAIFYSSLPPIVNMLPPSEVESMFNDFADSFLSQMPATMEVNESFLNEFNPDIMTTLNMARHYIGYFQIVYWALIIAAGLLIMGIILLTRRVRGATRWIGIPCLITGILSYVGTFIARHFAEGLMSPLNMPSGLQVWLDRFLNDALAPMRIYGIVLMAVGVALLIISVVYRRGENDYYPD